MLANASKEVDLKKTTREFADWISSKEGQKAIEETVKKSREIRMILDEAHRLDPKILDICFTI